MRTSASSGDPNHPNDLKLGALIKHHWSDWLFLIVLIILEIILNLIHPYRRYVSAVMFSTGHYSYPIMSQTVPLAAVPIIAIVIPLVFIIIFFIWKRTSRDLHHAILGLLTAVLLTAVITDALKDGLGMLRPDFYARCFGSPLATPFYGPDGNVMCTGTASAIKEGYKAFPSGHTSWSFAGLGYLAMYLAGKVGFFDRKGHSWKLFPVVLPLLLATLVGVSRIDNYYHHWFDVVVAALLGLLVAYFCYRLHYPSLFDEDRASPFPFMDPRRDIPLTATSSDYPNHHFNAGGV